MTKLSDPNSPALEKVLSAQLVSLLSPEQPSWARFAAALTDEVYFSLLAVALRFYVNSSILWCLRNDIYRELDCSEEAEIILLSDYSGFKGYNYNLFDHWSRIATPDNLIACHIPLLRSFILRNPSNFSPYNVILSAVFKADDKVALSENVLRSLELPSSLTSESEAYRDFMISLFFLLEPQTTTFLSEALRPYSEFIDEYRGF